MKAPDLNDVKDRATALVDEAQAAASDLAKDAGEAALGFARDTRESGRDLAGDLGSTIQDSSKDLGKELGKGSRELGSDIEQGAKDLGSKVGKELDRSSKKAAKELEKAAKQAARDARKAGDQAWKAASDLRGDIGNGFDHASAAASHLASDLHDEARKGAKRWLRLPRIRVPRVEIEEVREDTGRRFDGLLAAASAGALQLGTNLAKASGRAIAPQRRAIVVPAAVPVVGIVIVAAGTGALLMYAFDPVAGPRRRAQARRKLVAGLRGARSRIGSAASGVSGRIDQMRSGGSKPVERKARRATVAAAPREPALAAAGSNGSN